MKETIGIFAHVDAGKTTLSEMLLYKSGAIRSAGRVDNGNTLMDYTYTEKSRGITIYSAVAALNWKKTQFYLVDTPGHKDFADETENTMCILDKAIVVVSAVEGVQSYTEEIWESLCEYHIPTVIFINKTDRAGADVQKVSEELKKLSENCVVLSEDTVAERNDVFLEKYLSGNFDFNDYRIAAWECVKERMIFPVMSGAALRDEGVGELLDMLDFLSCTKYDCEGDFGGIVWKIKYDKKGVKWAFVKVTEGRLKARSRIYMTDGTVYKAAEIRSLQGEKTTNIKEAVAGDICALSGINELKTGDILGVCKIKRLPGKEPVLISKAVTEDNINDVYKCLKIMSDEITTLNAEKHGNEVVISVNGIVQLQVLPEIISERFGFDVTFEKPEVVYKETIAEPVMGYGHYEPLRHYSEVHFKLEPQERGSGISFESQCSTDKFGKSWQNLVESHVFERKHKGILIGAELVDIKVILMAGKEHYLHTSGGDFREATYRAIRQGLMKSKSILLEPVYKAEFKTESELSGSVISRIIQMGGKPEEQHIEGDSTCITAKVPVTEMLEYVTEFNSMTHGSGAISIKKINWEPCHNQEQVIEEKGYSAENDLEQPADSVFCRKGKARLIKYDKVEEELYIPVDYDTGIK